MTESEKRFAARLEQEGFKVFKNGWPDFLVTSQDGATGYLIELKSGSDKLSPSQKAMIDALTGLGINVGVVRGDNDLRAIPLNGYNGLKHDFVGIFCGTVLNGVIDYLETKCNTPRGLNAGID